MTSRSFAVKSLSWCAPSDIPKRGEEGREKTIERQDKSSDVLLDPIDKFGVVAATSRNRIIGVNGKLPWNLPEDRKYFVNLTRDRILIMGRRTYEEQPNKSHICHAAYNIVVSNTMDDESACDAKIEVVRSFPEALHLAKNLVSNDKENDGTLECWIVGGERIYSEALSHPSAFELHLTIVDMDVDVSKLANDNLNTDVALFPPKYRWDRHFNEAQRSNHDTIDGEGNPLRFTQVIYRRKYT
eukprot:CAMPEP_0202491282 /NCGR_PEP_ID=MMETSP1361-20130828/8392_1 /ASSEMBLY_ACC=CAM_ASM_000849 /TAXON_ID=210615 /ORGANISM="Staurosira complex sp., Strain CCMP2646" /LENGTH=241 /DNA_ID=CAMNT_0049121301 /DNA_START=187 /DNA_END=912 /DNA_ORIENTATION=-